MPQDYAGLYDAYYFRHGCGTPYSRTPDRLAFFDTIAKHIAEEIGPRTALDAGCAMGFLVEGLRARGVEAEGIDVSEYAIGQVIEPLRPYCRLGSIAEPLPGRYDLIVCIEVLEHLPPAEGEQAIENLCRAADDILFSSTPFDYREATHFNVQPTEAWAERFARQGFVRDIDFDAAFITPWALRFRRSTAPLPRVVRDYERRFGLLAKENNDMRGLVLEMRGQLADLERRLETQASHLLDQTAQDRSQAPNDRAQAELAEIRATRGWKVLTRFWAIRRALFGPRRSANGAGRAPLPPPTESDHRQE